MKICFADERDKLIQEAFSSDSKNLHMSDKETSIDDNMSKFNEHITNIFNDIDSSTYCFVD
jgi:hypothetical protein